MRQNPPVPTLQIVQNIYGEYIVCIYTYCVYIYITCIYFMYTYAQNIIHTHVYISYTYVFFQYSDTCNSCTHIYVGLWMSGPQLALPSWMPSLCKSRNWIAIKPPACESHATSDSSVLDPLFREPDMFLYTRSLEYRNIAFGCVSALSKAASDVVCGFVQPVGF